MNHSREGGEYLGKFSMTTESVWIELVFGRINDKLGLFSAHESGHLTLKKVYPKQQLSDN